MGSQARPTTVENADAADEPSVISVSRPVPPPTAPTERAPHRLPCPARRTFPGHRDQVSQARRFIAEALGPVPVLDEATLLVSELCTNALLHTASGNGGTFEVSILPRETSVRVEVHDNGSHRLPVPGPPDDSAEAGRGLELVAAIADSWGHLGDEHGRSVFFELYWGT